MIKVEVPGSKSVTNRALLLASMAHGKSVLTNVLFSDDSRSFMDCLVKLGYDIVINEAAKTVELIGGAVPHKTAHINVRSAGTSARFITAMLAATSGEYVIDASLQMKARPMKPLMDVLVSLGCEVAYLEQDGHLPCRINGGNLSGGEVTIDGERSSQFTSALLMTGPLHSNDLCIKALGKETSKSYIAITLEMMKQFGCNAVDTPNGNGTYIVRAGQRYVPQAYKIEPDVSSACYFYAAAALSGESVLVKDVRFDCLQKQGDIGFLRILEQMGCRVSETHEGIALTGSDKLRGIDVDMNDCSDQAITLAVVAAFATTPTTIRNIEHIKYQESNRVEAVLTELTKLGIKCEEIDDVGGGIRIYPRVPKAGVVETYDDHRMAMAFYLMKFRVKGIEVANPSCVGKTFENYFYVMNEVFRELQGE